MATGGPGANAAAEKAVESYRSTLKEQIIRDEIERCAILGEHDTDESTLPRQVKYVSTVLTNFNTRDECNKKLEEIAILYVKIRLGYVPDGANPCEGDELQAMPPPSHPPRTPSLIRHISNFKHSSAVVGLNLCPYEPIKP